MDPYETLGVARDASPTEIRAAFRKLAKIHHPDRFIGTSPMVERLAQKRMSELNRAYQKIGPRFGPRPHEESPYAAARRAEDARRASTYDRWERAEREAAARAEARRAQEATEPAPDPAAAAAAAARAPVRQRPATIMGDGSPSTTSEFSRRLAEARAQRKVSEGEIETKRTRSRFGR